MNKTFWQAVQVIGTTCGIISVIGYIDAGLQLGLKGIIAKLIDSYRHLLDVSLFWLEPYLSSIIKYLSDIFRVKLHLYPHWKYVFMPAWLYFINNTRTNWNMGRRAYAVANGIWGSFLALAIAVGTGVIAPDVGSAYTTIIPVVGIAAFDIGSSVFVAALVGFANQRWTTAFAYHFKTRIRPSTIMAIPVITVGFLSNTHDMPGGNPILVLFYVALLAFRDMGIATWVARTQPLPDVDFSRRLTGQGSWQLGTYILYILLGATAGIVLAT